MRVFGVCALALGMSLAAHPTYGEPPCSIVETKLTEVLPAVVRSCQCLIEWQPMQLSYFMDDGDLAHYKNVATQIEYLDVGIARLDDESCSQKPLTLENAEEFKTWNLTLEEVIRTTLSNHQVVRTLGGGLLGSDCCATGMIRRSPVGPETQVFDGVVLTRTDKDIALDKFEQNVRNTVSDAENGYWELSFAYRNLQAQKAGRDSAQATWRRVHSLFIEGAQGGERDKEAAARTQFHTFDVQVKTALADLFRAERRLRYMMGLALSDGRLIRPKDEPTTAQVQFDWVSAKEEGLARSPELRMQRRAVQETELQVLAARNYLLPRFGAVERWRFMGLGDNLFAPTRNGVEPSQLGSDAYNNLTPGSYQNWNVGLQLSMPIGFRKELSGVRFYELQNARERAILREQELELNHQLGNAIANLVSQYHIAQDNLSRRVAAQNEMEAIRSQYEVGHGGVTLDMLLDAQRRRADVEIVYHRSLIDYNRAIMQVHFRKGSLLDYNHVYLAEGPGPTKDCLDSMNEVYQSSAAVCFDCGADRASGMRREHVVRPVAAVVSVEEPENHAVFWSAPDNAGYSASGGNYRKVASNKVSAARAKLSKYGTVEEKNSAKRGILAAMDEFFEEDMKQRQKALEAAKKQVADLEEQIAKRQAAKMELLFHQLKTFEFEAEGLSLFEENECSEDHLVEVCSEE